MKLKFLIVILILLQFNTSVLCQNERIISLGNSSIALIDSDLDLNLYDYGGNKAWLANDRLIDVLYIKAKFSHFNGDYLRYYDFKRSNYYSINFDGTKILKEGTFRGYVIYEIENRIDFNSALSRHPYNGAPFFMTDTTSGNFLYNGPKVGFEFSSELFKNFWYGIEFNYQLVDGLKNVYSRAKSLLRNINGSFNLACKFSKGFLLGAKISAFDNKESIESKSDDLIDVEIFNFRGDIYAFRRRGQVVSQTYKEKAVSYGIQTIINPSQKFILGAKGDYSKSILRTQYPYGMLKEWEEGFSLLEKYFVGVKARYLINKNLTVGSEFNYEQIRGWSRISESALMIWKWNVKNYSLGFGTSYKLNKLPILFTTELVFGKTTSDSAKYIDNKYSFNYDPFNDFHIGLELEIFDKIFLRTGYNYAFHKFDIIRGCQEVKTEIFMIGLGLYKWNSISIDGVISYSNQINILSERNNYANLLLNLKIFNY